MGKYLFLGLMLNSSVVFANTISENTNNSYIYYSNTSPNPLTVSAISIPDSTGYQKFYCLLPFPQNEAHLPSPTFSTRLTADNQLQQYFTVPSGKTYLYAFNSVCNSITNSETFLLKNDNIFNSSELGFLHVYQDTTTHTYSYTNNINKGFAGIWGQTVSVGSFPPLQITFIAQY